MFSDSLGPISFFGHFAMLEWSSLKVHFSMSVSLFPQESTLEAESSVRDIHALELLLVSSASLPCRSEGPLISS